MSSSKGLQNEPFPGHISEAELFRRERAQFALAERAANFGYWRYDIATQRSAWSPGMYKLLGVDPQTQAPDSEWLLSHVTDEDRRKVNAAIEAAIMAKSAFYYRTHSKDPTERVQIVDTHGEVEFGDDGNVVAVLGVCNDVTKEVVAETARMRAERRYRLMAEEASDAILLYAPGGRIVFTSSALERITGRGSHEIEEGRFVRLVHPADIEEANKVRSRPPPNQTRPRSRKRRNASTPPPMNHGFTAGSPCSSAARATRRATWLIWLSMAACYRKTGARDPSRGLVTLAARARRAG